ncbi:hypothetical protein P7C70_g6751, partial [Phenoliferia sp. Uapishka_3]
MSARSGRPRQSTVSYEEVESDVDMSDGEREELAAVAREKDWYLKIDLQEASDELEILQVLDESKPLPTGVGTKSRPAAKVAVELEVDRFVKERQTWAEKQYQDSRAIHNFIKQRQLEESARLHAENAILRQTQKTLFEQLEARIKPVMLGLGWSDQKCTQIFKLVCSQLKNARDYRYQDIHREVRYELWKSFFAKLTGGTIEDEYWTSIENKIVVVYEEGFVSYSYRTAEEATETRRLLLKPYYNQLSHRIENPIPGFYDFTSFPSVTSFWSEPSSTIDQQSFDIATPSILQEFEDHRKEFRIKVCRTILAANGTSSADLDVAAAEASADSSFFGRFTSTMQAHRFSSEFGSYPHAIPPPSEYRTRDVECLSNPSLVRFLRHVLDTAGLQEQTTFEEVQAAGLEFNWKEYAGSGTETAELTWNRIAYKYLSGGGRTSKRALPTLTLVRRKPQAVPRVLQGIFDSDDEDDSVEAEHSGSDDGDDSRSGDSDDEDE